MNFLDAFQNTLKFEGGYVDDAVDSGGTTKYGISQKAYPDIDIINLTWQDAREIYERDYWIKGKCESIPYGLRGIFFDMCVNHGIRGAVKILQRAARAGGSDIKLDGILGPKTISAIQYLIPDRLRAYRMLTFAKIVLRKPSQERFFVGWFRRCVTI